MRADLRALQAIHLAHATHVPFENVDLQSGRGISLELPALVDKLVRRRRGGYCFEQNTLLQAVLRQIGFEVEGFEARVRLGVIGIRPRTHMLLHVRLDGASWLADCGFGGHGLLLPLRLDAGEGVQEQFGQAYRIVADGALRVLQWRKDGVWTDLYAFVPEPRYEIDFAMGNHFTATYPLSPFLRTLVVMLPGPERRLILRDLVLTTTTAAGTVERRLVPDEVRPLLRTTFGLDVADDLPLRAIDGLGADAPLR